MRSILVAVLCAAVAPCSEPPARTVDQLWAGFDPRALPLDVEVVEESRDAARVLRKVYYTSEVSGAHKVRVVALYGFPAGGTKSPAILHIHGGGQTATPEYVEYWARRGYATLSINWGGYPLGPKGSGGNTDWGPIGANQRDTANTYRVTPDPRVNSWYHWTIACRRGLTFLEQQPEVDANRIGIFGVSMGGRLTFLVAGTDKRVKAAASVYGAVSMHRPIDGIPGSEQVAFTAADRDIWAATLDAEAYAPRIRCPFLYLSAANDFYGALDFVDSSLARIPHNMHWQTFSPHYNHHVASEQSRALPMWMDRWLNEGPAWPATPRMKLALRGVPFVEVAPAATGARSVRVYYSTDPYPQSRFWRSAEVRQRQGKWTAELPMTRSSKGLWAFANVMYDSGLSLSTRLVHAAASDLARAKVRETDPRTSTIDAFEHGAQDWYVPLASPNLVTGDKDWFGSVSNGLTPHASQGASWRLATRKISDPKWKAPPGAAISIQLRSEQPNTVLVVATENEYRRPRKARTFIARVRVEGGSGTQTVTVPLDSFRNIEGDDRLSSWDEVNVLALQSQYTIRSVPRDPALDRLVGDPWQGPAPVFLSLSWVAPAAR